MPINSDEMKPKLYQILNRIRSTNVLCEKKVSTTSQICSNQCVWLYIIHPTNFNVAFFCFNVFDTRTVVLQTLSSGSMSIKTVLADRGKNSEYFSLSLSLPVIVSAIVLQNDLGYCLIVLFSCSICWSHSSRDPIWLNHNIILSKR